MAAFAEGNLRIVHPAATSSDLVLILGIPNAATGGHQLVDGLLSEVFRAFNHRMVAKKPDRRRFIRRELRQLHEMSDARSRSPFGESYLLRLRSGTSQCDQERVGHAFEGRVE